jgi:hypothetical protein
MGVAFGTGTMITRKKIYQRTGLFSWVWHYSYTDLNGNAIEYGNHLSSLRLHLKRNGCKDVQVAWQPVQKGA